MLNCISIFSNRIPVLLVFVWPLVVLYSIDHLTDSEVWSLLLITLNILWRELGVEQGACCTNSAIDWKWGNIKDKFTFAHIVKGYKTQTELLLGLFAEIFAAIAELVQHKAGIYPPKERKKKWNERKKWTISNLVWILVARDTLLCTWLPTRLFIFGVMPKRRLSRVNETTREASTEGIDWTGSIHCICIHFTT